MFNTSKRFLRKMILIDGQTDTQIKPNIFFILQKNIYSKFHVIRNLKKYIKIYTLRLSIPNGISQLITYKT